MRRDIAPEEEGLRLRRLADEDGYRAFKVRVGKDCAHDVDAWPGRTEDLIPTVRRAVGDECFLMADANSCYTPERAIEVGRLLEQHGYRHFEEPCPYWELEWTAEVAAALDIPVAGGEQDNDLAQWRRMVRMDAVDVVQPDVCYVGGIERARQVASMAAAAGKPCTPHSANRSLVTVFTLHLLASIENAGTYVEFSIEPSGWAGELFDPPLVARDGAVSLPGLCPGWGVRIRDSWLATAVRQTTRVGSVC
jgi:L-alanine-DL-glutamate epimerase-like enolase superfamily enzyme